MPRTFIVLAFTIIDPNAPDEARRPFFGLILVSDLICAMDNDLSGVIQIAKWCNQGTASLGAFLRSQG